MAKRRVRADRTAAGLPVELTSRLDPMWRDDDAIRGFCRVHGLMPEPWRGPLSAFAHVAEAYAIAQGWVRRFANNPREFPDRVRMRVQGIPEFSFALLVQEEHGMGGELTKSQWEWIAGAERRSLAREMGTKEN